MKPAAWTRQLPWSIVAAAILLVGLGWLGIARVEELTDGNGRLLHQQMAYSAIALTAMLLLTIPSYRLLCRYSYAIFGLTIVLLAVVYLFAPINNAHRWIRLGPVGFQPSEVAKVAFVLALLRYLMHRDNYRRLRGLLAPLALTLLPVLLILKEPDLGTSLVFLPVFFIILFAAGAKRIDLACVVLAGLLVLPLLWTEMSREQKSRITVPWISRRRAANQATTPIICTRPSACGRWGASGAASSPANRPTTWCVCPSRGPQRFHFLRDRRAFRTAGNGPGVGAVRPAGLAGTRHRRRDAGTVRTAPGGGTGGAVCRRGTDQHRHDRRTAAHHGAVAAAGESWRLRAVGARRGPGPAAERWTSARLRSDQRTVSVRSGKWLVTCGWWLVVGEQPSVEVIEATKAMNVRTTDH